MSTATLNPPVTPVRPTAMAAQNGATDLHRKLKESSSQVDLKESRILSEALTIREAPDKVGVTQPPLAIKDLPATQPQMPHQDQQDTEPVAISYERVESPRNLEEPFDWDDFQARYDQAMAEAKTTEEALLNEFHELASVSTISVSRSEQC